MCDFKKEFLLCTCSNLLNPGKAAYKRKKKAGRLSFEYSWELYQYWGLKESRTRGVYELPVSMMETGLTADFILQHLNSRNCFDFDYMPSAGDNLKIRFTETSDRLEFIFNKGQWTKSFYSPFKHHTILIYKGRIKETNT